MKHLFFITCLLLIATFANAQQRSAADILNHKWINETKSAQLEFFTKDGKYFAKILLLKNIDSKDQKNADKSLRDRKISGSTIISNLSYTNNKYINGKIYSPERGQEANCTIEWIDDNTISISGSKGFISKKQIWKK